MSRILRTAVDQRSVIELARLVGYKPSPGVAASAFLAFTLSSAPGSPDNVLIPAGSRVQSVPAPGQSPQVFETFSDLTALIAYNALPAQTTLLPWGLNTGDLVHMGQRHQQQSQSRRRNPLRQLQALQFAHVRLGGLPHHHERRHQLRVRNQPRSRGTSRSRAGSV